MEEVKLLMAREIPRLRRYALALTHDAALADDIVQDCLERAIRKRHLWRRSGSIRNWLYKILYRVFLNHAVRHAKLRRGVPLDEMSESLSVPARQEDSLMCKSIAEAMQKLPSEQNAAIALTAIEGLSYDEAANVLGIRIGTLRSRIARGRESLRILYMEQPEEQNSRPALRRVK